MSLALLSLPLLSFQDDSGGPAVGWKIYTYEPGTTTPKAAYQDSEGVATHANPIVLDGRGEEEIWLDGAYKLVLKTDLDVTKRTADNITGYGAGLQTGYLTKSVAGSADVALTAAEQANAVIEFTGVLTGNINVTVGDDKEGYRWVLKNSTTGSYTLTFKTTSGTGVAITQGQTFEVYSGTANVVYFRGGITGTVSQSGGVPTGALMEYGTNANGEYWRYAGGMQICKHRTSASIAKTTASGNIFVSGEIAGPTFPAAFSAIPATNIYVENSGASAWIVSGGSAGASTTAWPNHRVADSVSATDTTVLTYTAIGQWF